MLRVKTLALDFQVSGEVADGYRMTGIDCDVTSVSVAGLRSVLANMNTLPIQSPELSVEGATATKNARLIWQIIFRQGLSWPDWTTRL